MSQPIDINDIYLQKEVAFVTQLQRYLANDTNVINNENELNEINTFPYQIRKIESAQKYLDQELTNVQPMLPEFQETFMQFRAQFGQRRLIFRMSDLIHKINKAEIPLIVESIQRHPTLNASCSLCNIATFEELFIVYKLPIDYPKDLEENDFNEFLKRIQSSNCLISITEQYICSLKEFIGFLNRSNETIDQVLILRIMNYISELLRKLSSQFSILVQNVDPQGVIFCCERRGKGFLSIKFDPQFIQFSQVLHAVDNHQEGRHLEHLEQYHLRIIENIYSFIVPGNENYQWNRGQEIENSSAESIRQFLGQVLPDVVANRHHRIRNIFDTNGNNQQLQVEQFRENSILHSLQRYRLFSDEEEQENEEEEEEEEEEEKKQEEEKMQKENADDYRQLPFLSNAPQNQIIDINSLFLQLWQASEAEVNQYFRNNLLNQHYLQSVECQTIKKLLLQHGYTVIKFSNFSMNSRGLLAEKEIQLEEGQSTRQEFYIKAYYLPTAHRETQQRLNNSASNLQLVGEQISKFEGDSTYFSESVIRDKNRYKMRVQQQEEQRQQRQLQQQQQENAQIQQVEVNIADDDAHQIMNVKPLIQTQRFSMIDIEDQIFNRGWEFVVFEECHCSLRDLVPAIAMLSNEVKSIVLEKICSGLFEFISHLDRLELTHSELTLDRILIDKDGILRINNCQAARSILSPPTVTLVPLAAKVLQLLSELDREYVRQEYANGSYKELVRKVDKISIAMMMAELTFGLNHHKLLAEYLNNHRTIMQRIQESAGLIQPQQGYENLNKLRFQQIGLFQNTKEAIRMLNVNLPRQGEVSLEDVQSMVLRLFENE